MSERKCSDGCGASTDDHCWNNSQWSEDILDSTCQLENPDVVPGIGDVVVFDDCVGYVDSTETAASGEGVANVVALKKKKPGEWQRFGNPSISAMCYRVPLSHLKKMYVGQEK